ncbi:MAG: glycyl-radical enzyme activating protein [Candidatus Hodarchaeota archaeon]
MSETLKGLIFNIQKFSTEDGPGIRTTVFMKGCPLNCKWCHNPEGIVGKPQVMWYDVRCKGFKDCIKACEQGALKLTKKGMIIDRGKCIACGSCDEACPANAIELIGKEYSVQEVIKEVAKDKAFYDKSGGGMTISGGEPLVQFDFTKVLSIEARKQGIKVALDTTGYSKKFEEILEHVDLVLYDLKHHDADMHFKFTRVKPELIINNAKLLAKHQKPTWIRTPIIPGFTDQDDNIRNIARFIVQEMPTVERYDLLSFNNLCTAKYKRLDMSFPLEGDELLTKERMEELKNIALDEGVKNVKWSGITKSEKRDE